jgi:hypothetical protein
MLVNLVIPSRHARAAYLGGYTLESRVHTANGIQAKFELATVHNTLDDAVVVKSRVPFDTKVFVQLGTPLSDIRILYQANLVGT